MVNIRAKTLFAAAIYIFTILFSVGCCTIPGPELEFYYEADCSEEITAENRFIEVSYLGAGGYLIQRGPDKLLIAPFFSNPGLFRVGLATIKSKPGIIEQYLPPVDDVETILIGHSHYDHLMDIPYIAKFLAPNANIYGNKSMTHLLAPFFETKDRFFELNSKAGDNGVPGEWVCVPDGRIRFMAIKSEHAPHFLGINLLGGGKQDEDLEYRPQTAFQWKQGEVFTFIIDFMGPDGETVDFRIHYQDSASNPPMGFPPEGIKNIDLSILCAASFREVDDYPETFLETAKPKHIIVGHWENFFRSYSKPVRTVPLTDVKEFIRIVIDTLNKLLLVSDCYVPKPGSCISFPIEN